MAHESPGVLDLTGHGDGAVEEADDESVTSLSTYTAQKCQPRVDASNITDDNNKNTPQSPSNNVNEDFSLEIPEHCIVDNTPPQNRKKTKLVLANSLGIWKDIKRFKGFDEARRPYLAKYTHVSRVVKPNGEMCNELLKLYKGKLFGKGASTGSWINIKAEKHIVNNHSGHNRQEMKAEREVIAHEAKVTFMLQQPTRCAALSSHLLHIFRIKAHKYFSSL